LAVTPYHRLWKAQRRERRNTAVKRQDCAGWRTESLPAESESNSSPRRRSMKKWRAALRLAAKLAPPTPHRVSRDQKRRQPTVVPDLVGITRRKQCENGEHRGPAPQPQNGGSRGSGRALPRRGRRQRLEGRKGVGTDAKSSIAIGSAPCDLRRSSHWRGWPLYRRNRDRHQRFVDRWPRVFIVFIVRVIRRIARRLWLSWLTSHSPNSAQRITSFLALSRTRKKAARFSKRPVEGVPVMATAAVEARLSSAPGRAIRKPRPSGRG
jgi:hypothetical protein